MRSHPDFAKFAETMKAEQDQAQKDFDAKAPTLGNDKKNRNISCSSTTADMKQAELLKPIEDKVMATIKDVAEARGLAVVMPANMVVYGGQDITDEVKKKLGGK
jgi:outer membrane protein